ASARFSVAKARLSPVLWTALDADNQRARLPLHYTLRGNSRGEAIEIASALTYHRFGDEDFSNLAAEVSLAARFEMQRLGKSLQGSFSSVSVGGGVQRTHYGIDGVASDIGALLLGHFGYGFYLPEGGELEAYYEHRRDGFTAGLSPSERNGSGFLGHF